MQAGIPTVYAGTRFRSRLEARWAVFFDQIGWRWEYEPFDLEGYIPDFLIVGKAELLVEVKPRGTVRELADVATAIATACAGRDVLAVGYTIFPAEDDDTGRWPAGALNEWHEDQPVWIAAGRWHLCRQCRQVGVHHDLGSFHGRPCGHAEGDHLLDWVDPSELKGFWAHACNVTQWKAPA